MPILVLDASARVRATYRQQERNTEEVATLTRCDKRFSNVRVFFKEAESGKKAMNRKAPPKQPKKAVAALSLTPPQNFYQVRIRETIDVINSNPGRKVLVLYHKMANTLPRDVRKGVHDPEADIRFCTWGRHDATNEFADCDLVITASILRYPTEVDRAKGRGVSDRPVEEPYTDKEQREIVTGEILHNLLQGVSRGCIRYLEGDEARACDVYLVAGKNSGIKARIELELFPGCTMIDGWGEKAAPKGLSEHARSIRDHLINSDADSLTFPEVQEATGIGKNHFNRYLQQIGSLTPYGWGIEGGRPKRFVRVSAVPAEEAGHG